MNVILFGGLFIMAVLIGTVIMGTYKRTVKCKTRGHEFTITYKDRTLYITASREKRIPSYKRVGSFEFITIPVGRGHEGITQIENFMQRYRTSILAKGLFNFSAKRHPIKLFQFDPEYARELVEIQHKLHCFCKMK
ncbi:hypothetical protein OBP_309 [Pseudomonas phage OBP]|uniref:hypothetical protein n=1 Tax=Pseudomonas phage OBP TaxID=1124849 RepID=UPI000240D650|nr:hypothetical protein OBP_309 [Pseudomonas phage OBP]AEV89746.1 hypothetical protein OBP_309 [Pseudomonas phage OBP]